MALRQAAQLRAALALEERPRVVRLLEVRLWVERRREALALEGRRRAVHLVPVGRPPVEVEAWPRVVPMRVARMREDRARAVRRAPGEAAAEMLKARDAERPAR